MARNVTGMSEEDDYSQSPISLKIYHTGRRVSDLEFSADQLRAAGERRCGRLRMVQRGGRCLGAADAAATGFTVAHVNDVVERCQHQLPDFFIRTINSDVVRALVYSDPFIQNIS